MTYVKDVYGRGKQKSSINPSIEGLVNEYY